MKPELLHLKPALATLPASAIYYGIILWYDTSPKCLQIEANTAIEAAIVANAGFKLNRSGFRCKEIQIVI